METPDICENTQKDTLQDFIPLERIPLYKEFYFRDLSRRTELDTAVNMPVLSVTSLVTLNMYYIKELNQFPDPLSFTLYILIFCAILLSLFFLAKSFFNLGKTNTYKELETMNHYYKFSNDEIDKGTPEHFEIFLEKELADCTGHNTKINKDRTVALAWGKQFLFGAIVLTVLTTGTFINAIINKQ